MCYTVSGSKEPSEIAWEKQTHRSVLEADLKSALETAESRQAALRTCPPHLLDMTREELRKIGLHF